MTRVVGRGGAPSGQRWPCQCCAHRRVRWRISAGSLAVTREAVLAGLGLMRVPEFVVERDLKSGALVRLLADDPLPIAQATALYPRSKVSSRALRFLLDHLSKRPSSDNLAPGC